MAKIGDRVGAMMSGRDGVIEFLGFGVYQGEEVPPKEIMGFNFGYPNPKILLDNGEVVWGCECWWGDEPRFKEILEKAKEVKIVSIVTCRKEAKLADDMEKLAQSN
jgi:hypothetical protein